MAVLRTRAVDRALVGKLGFEGAETHHHVYRLCPDGVLAARTYASHGGRELSRCHVQTELVNHDYGPSRSIRIASS